MKMKVSFLRGIMLEKDRFLMPIGHTMSYDGIIWSKSSTFPIFTWKHRSKSFILYSFDPDRVTCPQVILDDKRILTSFTTCWDIDDFFHPIVYFMRRLGNISLSIYIYYIFDIQDFFSKYESFIWKDPFKQKSLFLLNQWSSTKCISNQDSLNNIQAQIPSIVKSRGDICSYL